MRTHRKSTWALLLLVPFLHACASSGAGDTEPLDLASLSGQGPYQVLSYSDFPSVPEFAAGTVYYPSDARERVAGVAIAPGFTEEQRHIDWWGPRLASHGYAVLVLDTNDRRDRPDLRADALMAGVGVLRAENDRRDSPLRGRIDVDKMAIMGHSMGGGGVLLAANEHSDELRAAIPFTPWEPDATFEGITVPTLVMAGSADRIAAIDAHAWRHFQSIPSTTPKVYMEVEGGNHYIADTERGPDLAMVGRFGIAWLKLYVDGDERYRDLIYGSLDPADEAKLSRYVATQ